MTRAGAGVLEAGFRPFFMLAGLWAVIGMGLWLASVRGAIALPSAFGAITWHAHEMLFGYVAAAIAGFLLTAIPNWTGRPALQGLPLAALAALWLAGRLAVAGSALIGPLAAALVDCAFLAVMLGIALREILAGGNRRNLPIAGAIALLLAANVMMHAGPLGAPAVGAAGLRLAIAVIVLLISLVGGRIVPNFTSNWLRERGAGRLPAPFARVDAIALAATAAALVVWVAWPRGELTAALMLAAGLLQGMRLLRWRGHATAPEPLLWVLHLGYAWVPVGLALLALALLRPGLATSAALHVLTVGAMGTMTLAVMTRATLGHTGRALTAGPATTSAFALLAGAVLARLGAPLWPGQYLGLLTAAAALWIAAFGVYLAVYAPMQWHART